MAAMETPDPLFGLFDGADPWRGPYHEFIEEKKDYFLLRPGHTFFISAQGPQPGRPQEMHGHHFLEALLVFAGSLSHQGAGGTHRVKPFEAIFLGPGQRHRFEALEKDTAMVTFCFRPSFLGYNDRLMEEAGILEMCTALGAFHPTAHPGPRSLPEATARKILFHGFHAIERLREHPNEVNGICRDSFHLGLNLLLEACPGTNEGVAPSGPDVLPYLQTHFKEKLQLKDVAGVFHLSVAELSRHFKKLTGTTLARHLGRLRVDAAKGLLTNSALPVGHLAREVGFESVTHFNDVFKEHTGVTPSQFRKDTGKNG